VNGDSLIHTTARSSSGVVAGPRRPTCTSIDRPAGTCTVSDDRRSSALVAPPVPAPLQALGRIVLTAAPLVTKAARSGTLSVRPDASTVISRMVGAGSTRNQTVRANELEPRHLGTPRSAVASTSSALPILSSASPI
jgi:hypothetical protein